MVNATQSRKPRQRQPRSVAVVVPLNEFGRNGVVRLTVGKVSGLYFVDRVEADYGEGFALTKVSGEPGEPETRYHVNLDPAAPSCECAGHLRWGSECKHLGACRVLKERGKLPAPVAQDDPELLEYKPAGHSHGCPF